MMQPFAAAFSAWRHCFSAGFPFFGLIIFERLF